MPIASQLPHPADPSFPAILGALAAFLGAATCVWTRNPDWTAAQEAAFRWGFYGTVLGLLIWGFGFITGLY